MTDEAIKKMRDAIVAALEGMWEVTRDEGGCFCYEIYADYRDEMQDSSAIEILQSENPYLTFWEKMNEWYFDYENQLRDELDGSVEKKLTEEGWPYCGGFSDEEKEAFSDLMMDLVYFSLPEDHYLGQSFNVPIMVDTGDGNYDYTLNSVYPCWYGRYEDRLDDKASIVWLARQQGYTKTQLWKALRDGDVESPKGFLESMRQEIANVCSSMETLTFLVKMTLRDLIELNRLIKLQDRNGRNYDARKNPYCGYIVLGKTVMAGLFDPWNGGGSVLEIELEKDVRLPIKFIRSALPDGADGYGVDSVYGLCGSAWTQGEVTKIHCPKALTEEALAG